MTKLYDIAVVGATGAVGETILKVLEERKFPVGTLYPLASSRSAGKKIQFDGKWIKVLDLEKFDFSKAQIGLFSPGASVSKVYAPKAAEAG
ncbi:MAG: aspartate-semialdehyde dehydrogenase, partial [Gammaproteobacteria bacterium]|nr:aspartate-semialdehyde dehydrogenase [Gammaproteobacteria bacterium]